MTTSMMRDRTTTEAAVAYLDSCTPPEGGATIEVFYRNLPGSPWHHATLSMMDIGAGARIKTFYVDGEVYNPWPNPGAIGRNQEAEQPVVTRRLGSLDADLPTHPYSDHFAIPSLDPHGPLEARCLRLDGRIVSLHIGDETYDLRERRADVEEHSSPCVLKAGGRVIDV